MSFNNMSDMTSKVYYNCNNLKIATILRSNKYLEIMIVAI